MSYTELYAAYEDGDLVMESEFQNAYGGAMFVWDALVRKYDIPGERFVFDTSAKDCYRQLWDFAKEHPERLESWEMNVLLSTYDNVIVTREGMLVLAESMDKFKAALWNKEVVCNLAEQAKAIRGAHKDGARAIAWNQTSVNCDVWRGERDEETEENAPYNIDRDDKHWEAEILPIDGSDPETKRALE